MCVYTQINVGVELGEVFLFFKRRSEVRCSSLHLKVQHDRLRQGDYGSQLVFNKILSTKENELTRWLNGQDMCAAKPGNLSQIPGTCVTERTPTS